MVVLDQALMRYSPAGVPVTALLINGSEVRALHGSPVFVSIIEGFVQR
jgi:primosomal replication protein N